MTGFDGSMMRRNQVEEAGSLVKHPQTNKCKLI